MGKAGSGLVIPVCMAASLVAGLPGAGAKECSRTITAAMRGHAVANTGRYDWAGSQQRAAVRAAAAWVKQSDEFLWRLVPSQELPRDIYSNNVDASKSIGCAACGEGYRPYGRWGFKTDIFGRPWKMICPNCKAAFPKNDFGAFYTSALDEHGFFRRELGDRSLLFNAEHPAADDPLRSVYVDDGYGMVDEAGNRRLPIAYYCQWGLWRGIGRGLKALSMAYCLTNDQRYAHKAAVLLNRIADVYPEMAWNPLAKIGFKHSDGSSKRGRIEGRIWECGLATGMALAYDRIYDGIQGDTELAQFCDAMAVAHELPRRESVAALCRHIEDHLLVEILEGTRAGDIYGNTGMQQTTVVSAAIALDRPGLTQQWLDWLFDPGYPGDFTKKHDSIPWVLTEGFDRDGMGGEVGGYGLIWTNSFISLAEQLARYPAYTGHDLLREFPKLKQCFLVQARLNCLDAAMPNIGDNGRTGYMRRAGSTDIFLRGYRLYGDERLASLAHHFAGGNLQRLRMADSIFEADPEKIAGEVAAIAARHPFRVGSTHLGRYGQAVLQSPGPDPARGRAAWLHHGYRLGHSHRDSLNLGLYAHNISMLPDLGYPEYCEGRPKQYAWTANTISHNTLLVGDKPQAYSPGGKIKLFADIAPLRAMDVASPGAYPACKTYRRTVAMVDVAGGSSYVLDVFRARGGSNHRLLYQGPAQEATLHGLTTVAQPTGTFAGPKIELDRVKTNGGRDPLLYASGFSFLWDIERRPGPVADPYTVDWKVEDRRGRIKAGAEPHLRIHALTPCDEVALASGQPPPNKPGNPKSLRKLIQSRLGKDVHSQFVNVLEPYDTTPFVRRVRRLAVVHQADPDAVAVVEVTLADGTVDVLISCEIPTAVQVEGGIEFDGSLALIRRTGSGVVLMRMCMGTRLAYGGHELVAERAAYRGVVTAADATDSAANLVHLDPPLPKASGLVGQTIQFGNALPLDTSYVIREVTPTGISTGDVTIIRGLKDHSDYAAGHTFLVHAGDTYTVPVCVGLEVQ